MESVWIVSSGENGACGDVVSGGVFNRKPSEKRVMGLSKPRFGPWVRFKSVKSVSRWQSGCDFLLLEKHEVQ